jgi:acyl-coenzyme A synthetase/AMP-(fatty) acid ligase
MSCTPQSPTRSSGQIVADLLDSLSRTHGVAFVTQDHSVTWDAWLNSVDRLVENYEFLRRARAGLLLRPSEKSYASLVALWRLDCDLFILDGGMSAEEIRALAESHRLDTVIDPARERESSGNDLFENLCQSPRSGHGRATIFTSGSTGRAKAVCHDWQSLTRPVRRLRSYRPACWLLTYRPHLYAGLQVFFHCLLNQETLVVPEPGMSVDPLLDLMRRSEVTSISATPSYWRRLITMGRPDELRTLPLEQITLGGEVADQGLLDALRRFYPQSRLTHIYATSELGRCFSVKDGRAGFPACLLDGPSEEGVELKVEDGELHVRSANAMLAPVGSGESDTPAADWIPTGDLIERSGDRCFFVGRRNEILNVGGNKVHPLRVEQVIQQVSGVRDVRVFARSSSLVGQMVACEFVAEPGLEELHVKRLILETCLEKLEAHERPRFVGAVPAITLSNAGKRTRQSGTTSSEDRLSMTATQAADRNS